MALRFRFRLQTVLRVRELREREAKRKVGAKLAEIAALDHANQQAAAEIARCQRVLLSKQGDQPLNIRDLAASRGWIAHLRRTIVERQIARQALVAELDALRRALAQARTQTRVLEKLRERRLTEWKRAAGVREQNETDEVAQRLLIHQAGGWPASDDEAQA
ncbi:MAG: flagellar export protein FliJ [Planctomycetes bacterium]|nr:flagellar export protein FliJ [Planctomycetota bacterium]